MFFVLSKLLDIFLSPLAWGLILLAIAIPWRRPRRRARWKKQRLFGALGIFGLLFFSTDLVGNALLHRLEHTVESTNRPEEVYDAVVLLGGVADEDVEVDTGQLGLNDSVERLIATHRALTDGHARFAILSGAATSPAMADHSEARMLARQLVLWGIPPSRIILEEQARNTHENAVYSRKIAVERGFAKVLIITSAFHMARAVECFGAVEMPVDTLIVDYRTHVRQQPFPDLILPRTYSLWQSAVAIREMAGLQIYRFQGYAKPPIKMP